MKRREEWLGGKKQGCLVKGMDKQKSSSPHARVHKQANINCRLHFIRNKMERDVAVTIRINNYHALKG